MGYNFIDVPVFILKTHQLSYFVISISFCPVHNHSQAEADTKRRKANIPGFGLDDFLIEVESEILIGFRDGFGRIITLFVRMATRKEKQ